MKAEEMKNSMTIYYFKSTGKIHAVATGIQDMNYYGDNAEDFALIIDYIVAPKDYNVINEFSKFVVNTETKRIEIKAEFVSSYPIASN